MPPIKANDLFDKLKSLSGEPENQVAYLKKSRVILDSVLWGRVCDELDGNSNPVISRFLEDGNALRAMLDDAKADVDSHQEFLDSVKWEYLLASFAVYLEQWYFAVKTEGQFHIKRSNLIPVLQRVSADKHHRERQNKKKRKKWGGKRAIEAALNSIRSRLKQGLPIEAYGLFESWNVVLEIECLVDNYCLKGWMIHHEPIFEVVPESKDVWENWIFTNHKFQLIDRFYLTLPYKAYPDEVQKITTFAPNEETAQQNIEALGGITFIEDLLGTTDIKLEGNDIDLYETLQLIGKFDSCYKSNFIPAMQHYKNNGSSFAEVMQIPSDVLMPCITARSKNEMLGMMTQFDSTKPSQKRLKSCLTALELFAGPPHMTAVENGQFLRAQDGSYIVMPRYFHGDVKTALLNSVIRKMRRENKERQFSVAQEKFLGERFASQGYSTLVDWNYKSEEIGEGQVDVFAYKSGYLFVVEAKLTYFRDQTHGIYSNEGPFKKAERQLTRAVEAVEKEFDTLKGELGISEDFDDLVVVPLIVSTPPEFDFKKYSGIHKLSQFELQGLLDPGSFIFMRAVMAEYNAFVEIASARNEQEQLTLSAKYQQGDHLLLEIQRVQEQSVEEAELIATEPERLVQAIETGAFWQGLEDNHEITQGPVKLSMTLKNGDEIRYVI